MPPMLQECNGRLTCHVNGPELIPPSGCPNHGVHLRLPQEWRGGHAPDTPLEESSGSDPGESP